MHTSTMNRVKAIGKKVLGVLALGAFLGGGILTAAADGGTPAFNNLSNDYPTLQVAKPNQSWSTSTTAAVGEVVNLLVWDHNTVPGSTATNVKVKVTLPTTVASTHVPSATVSADNATAVTGTSTINVGAASKISYIPGTAKFLKNVNGTMTVVNWPTGVNPDDVVGNGVNLGSQAGCWQYAQAVMLQVRVDGGAFTINTNKRVELVGGQNPFDLSATAQPGDEVAFRIFVQNTGNMVGTHPKIVDTLDSHLTYSPGSSFLNIKKDNQDYRVDIADNLIKFEGQKITWALNDMQPTPDAAVYLYFKARVAAAASFPVGQTKFVNCAKAVFDQGSADTNCVDIIVNRAADKVVNFTLRKEVTNLTLGDSKWYDQQLASAAPGDLVAYRLTLQNTGNTTANTVTVQDILPNGITFEANSIKLYNKANPNGVAVSGNALVNSGYVFSSVPNGSDNIQTLIFSARITNNCSGQQTLTNLAKVIYNSQVKAQDDATLVISCTRGLIITKDIKNASGQYVDDAGIVHEGQVLTYRINVQNNGNVVVNNPLLRDVLPGQVTYVQNSLAIDGEFMSTGIQQAFFSNGMILTNLNPGMGKVITFQVKVNDCPDLGDTVITNTAYVKADNVAEISDTAKATIRVNKPILQ